MNVAIPTPSPKDASQLASLIGEQSAAEIAQLLADARAHADRIRAAAASEVDDIKAAATRAGEDRGRRRAAAALATAEAQSRLLVLRAREALITTALARAQERLGALEAQPNACDVLVALMREALHDLPPGPVRVRLAERTATLLDDTMRRQLAAGRWALRFETGAVPGGGVIIETEDGRLRFDNSLPARFRRRAADLRRLAADLLDTAPAQEAPR